MPANRRKRSPSPRPWREKSRSKDSSSNGELVDNGISLMRAVRTAFAALKTKRLKSEALTLMKEDMDKDHGTWEGKKRGKSGKDSGGKAKRYQ